METKGNIKNDISDALHRPLRALPPALMDKFLKRTTANIEAEGSQKKGNENTNKVIDIISEATQESEGIDQVAAAEKAGAKRKIIRLKWRRAYLGVILGKVFVDLYEALRQKALDLQKSNSMEAEGIAFLLSSHVAKPDAALSARLRELTSKEDRTDADVEALERILSIRIRSFGRFTTDQRVKFCRILKYENFDGVFLADVFLLLNHNKVEQERTIVKEGHVSWAFYFILSGQGTKLGYGSD